MLPVGICRGAQTRDSPPVQLGLLGRGSPTQLVLRRDLLLGWFFVCGTPSPDAALRRDPLSLIPPQATSHPGSCALRRGPDPGSIPLFYWCTLGRGTPTQTVLRRDLLFCFRWNLRRCNNPAHRPRQYGGGIPSGVSGGKRRRGTARASPPEWQMYIRRRFIDPT